MTTPRKKQLGLSLIELMVAITISLLLLAGVIQIFLSTKQAYRIQEASSRVQENGRFAIEFLARDLRMADYWGCARTVGQVSSMLNSTGSGYIDFLSGGLGGTDNAGLNGSDTLILQGAYGTGLTVETPYMTVPSSSLHIPVGSNIKQGDIMMVSDCVAADIFQVTNNNPDTSGTLDHSPAGGSVSPGNANPADMSKTYAGDAEVYRVIRHVYSIGTGASGEPALFRSENGAAAVELIEGVENMQVTYGEDTDDDGTANYYVSLPNVGDMEEVVSVKVSLLLRSESDHVTDQKMQFPYNGATYVSADNRLRRVFDTTVNLRNRTN